MPDLTVVKVLQERGEINDELDYALMNYLLTNRGPGYTACQPQLVELNDGNKAIKLSIDHTFLGDNNELLGLGIVGIIIVDYEKLTITYCTPVEELEQNILKLKNAGVKPQPRPKGKY